MRDSLGSCLLTATALLLAGCAAPPPPNLSGEWRLEGGGALAIDHRDPQFTVRAPAGSAVPSAAYTADGSEACNLLDGNMLCSRGRWDGPYLVIDSTMPGEAKPTRIRERWSLGADGRSLTLQRRTETAGRESVTTLRMTRR